MAKPWFPIFRLSVFFLVVASTMFLFLNAFNPHIERDPKEWENDKPKVSKQVEFMMRLFGPKKKGDKK